MKKVYSTRFFYALTSLIMYMKKLLQSDSLVEKSVVLMLQCRNDVLIQCRKMKYSAIFVILSIFVVGHFYDGVG